MSSQPNQKLMAAQDDQHKPLSPPPEIHPPPTKPTTPRHRKCTIYCGIATVVILLIAVTLLTLGLTLFRVKNPQIKMNSVTLIGLDRVNSTDLLGLLTGKANLTVMADVSVKNLNAVAFKFKKSNSSLVYRDTVVGVAEVAGGVAPARRTMRMNLSYEVSMGEIVGNKEFGSDLMSGIVKVESYTKINGRVKILKIIKKKATVTMNCTIDVNITSRGIAGQSCERHVYI